MQVEQPLMVAPPEPERLTDQLEPHGGHQQDQLPVDLPAPQHVPGPDGEARHDEGRKVPDGFFRAQLAEAAASKAAADGKGQRDELAVGQGRQAHHRADDGAGVGADDEADDKGPFEGEIGRVIVQEEPGGDASRERKAEGHREQQAVGPSTAFEDQDVPEPAVAHQHGGQRRHDRELHDQGREQHLLG